MKAQTEVNSSSFNFPGGLASPLDSKGDRKKTPAQGAGPLIHPFTGSGGRQWLLLFGQQALSAYAPHLTRMRNSPNPVRGVAHNAHSLVTPATGQGWCALHPIVP